MKERRGMGRPKKMKKKSIIKERKGKEEEGK